MRSVKVIVTACLFLLAAATGVADEGPRILRSAVTACGDSTDEVEDLYAIDIPDASRVMLELTVPNPAADFDLSLMAPDGEKGMRLIAAASSRESGRTEKITASLSRGKYYVAVSAIAGSSTYALTLSAPELQGTSNVEVRKILSACASGGSEAQATVTVADQLSDAANDPANRREAFLEEIAGQDVEINAFGKSRRRAALHPPPCTYAVSATAQTVTSIAGTGSVGVTTRSDCGWTASTTATWLTITGKTGVGNGSVDYSFLANTSSSSRTGTITAAGKTVSITQSPACTYTVSPTSKDFASTGGTGTISVTTRSDCAWTATVAASAPWITITGGQSGTGNGTVAYSVAPNSATSARSGTMTIGGRSVSINQALDASSCTYSPAYTTKTITWCGGERTIQVTTQGDCPWTATSDASWLTIVLASRSGTRSLSYTVAPNATGASRQATLTVAGTPVRITQNARSGNGTYDGNWTGTTNGGRAVSLCVAEGAIQSASISVRLEFPTFFCTTPLIRQSELPFTGTTFSGTFTTFPEVSNVFTTARGTFTSPSAVNGSWDAFSQSYLIICGSTIGFGTGGTILFPGTFTATKQP